MPIVLLDADVIIDLHRFHIWETIRKSGLTKCLETKHTENYFKKYLAEGSLLRIQRFETE